jgi:hypothetical protein
MRLVSRVVVLATFGASALVTGAALMGLGSDRWISSGYASHSVQQRVDVWGVDIAGGALKPAAATEAEWLSARGATSLHPAAVLGASRIDLGPLDVIDVHPLPRGVDLGHGPGGTAKLLVSAREPGSGRTVQFIVDAAAPAAPRAAKQDGL